jgi:hypothetical protein
LLEESAKYSVLPPMNAMLGTLAEKTAFVPTAFTAAPEGAVGLPARVETVQEAPCASIITRRTVVEYAEGLLSVTKREAAPSQARPVGP